MTTRVKLHELKTWPIYWLDLADGPKRFEYRRDDRDFQVGDAVVLREWSPIDEDYSGNELGVVITYVLREAPWLAEGYCVFGFDVVTKTDAAEGRRHNPAVDEEFDGMAVRWEDLDHSHDDEAVEHE